MIDWKFCNEAVHDFELYELLRSNNRQSSTQMKIPPIVRSEILSEMGYSSKDIREASKEATIIRRQRMKTITMLHTEEVEEKWESVKRVLRSPFKSRGKRQKEKHYKEWLSDHGHNKEGIQRNTPEMDTTKGRNDYTLSGKKQIVETGVSRHGKKYDLTLCFEEVNEFDSYRVTNIWYPK